MKLSVAAIITQLIVMWTASEARSIHDSTNMWKPENGSPDQLYTYHGFSQQEWKRTVEKMHQLKMMVATNARGLAYDVQAMDSEPDHDQQYERLDKCIWLVEDQVDELLQQEHEHVQSGGRKKRTIDQSAFLRWDMPIHWKFDGNHTTSEKRIIRSAFKQWEDNTCARFSELGTNERFTDHHLLITRSGQGCYSFVGRVAPIPQQLNLHSICLKEIGTPVHEIGHVLGLWHEQQRSDRDDSIRVLWNNVGYLAGQFFKRRTDNLGVPYNVGSVMHYGPKSGSKNGGNTMEALDNEYQPNMGQRVELSFSDAKIINLAYCTKICRDHQLSRPCERSGYQDPNNCHKCKCPFGFSGDYCENVANSLNAQCGGEIRVTNTPTIIKSPGYDSPRHYDSRQQCNWLITAPANHHVVLKFEDDFGVYCHNDKQCYHWVEVRYGKDIGLQGPRHCCYKRPSDATKSLTNEMMVIFKSNWDVPWATAKRGFRASIVAEPMDGYRQPPNTPAPAVKTTRPAACKKTDLAFLIDSSASVTADNWAKMSAFISRFVADLTTGRDCVRVSVVTFGDKPKMHFDLRAHDSLHDLQALLNDVGRNMHTTDIAGGLDMVRSTVFQSNRGDRSDAPNVCVLLTDGQSASGDKSNALARARDVRRAGIKMFAVGVGSGVDSNELNNIAGSSTRVVLVNNFNSLGDQNTLSRLHRAVFINAGAATTTSRTTTTTSTTTTTTTTTTTSSPSSSSVNWKCSFEDSAGRKTLCDMSQSASDNFDWTLLSGPTPSGETGPDAAYNGQYYAFIETSSPREFGDKAALYAPALGVTGKHCVRFNYHMYGFHIHKLQLVKKSTWGEVTELWFRTKDLGSRWWDAAVTVDIKSTDRIGFVATRGHEYSGDIGLDNVRIKSGQC